MLANVGITYTMADKESESVPYIDISKSTFLKRKFVWDADIGAVVAPLEEESIIKSLMVTVESKSVSAEHQAVSIISSAVREYFFHGRETFHDMSDLLKEIIDECGLVAYVEDSTFPTYEELKKSFWRASKHLIAEMRPEWSEEQIELEIQAEDDLPVCPICGFVGQVGQTVEELEQRCIDILRYRYELDELRNTSDTGSSSSECSSSDGRDEWGRCVTCFSYDCLFPSSICLPRLFEICPNCLTCKFKRRVCTLCLNYSEGLE